MIDNLNEGGSPTAIISLGICSICVMSLILALPITQLYFGCYYVNLIPCDSGIIPIPIPIWLIVKGSVNIFEIIAALCMLFTRKSALFISYIMSVIYALLLLFNLSWLIVGSIIFWKYCSNIEPDSVNTLMWCSLILGYISVFQISAIKNVDL